MAKIVVCIAVLILSTVMGKSFSDKHDKRYQFYNSLKNFNLSLKQNIKFKRKGVLQLFEDKSYCADFSFLLSSYKLSVLQGFDKKLSFPTWADREDEEFLTTYLNGLGKNSSETELDFINSYEEIINQKLIKIEENKHKFSKLGQKLGFTVGLGLVIIII